MRHREIFGTFPEELSIKVPRVLRRRVHWVRRAVMGRFDVSGRGRGGRGGRGAGRHPNGGNSGRGMGGVGAISYAAQSAAEKEAALIPFLHPTPRVLVPVPLEFESPRHFCELIANNLLAEFWYLIQEGPRGAALKATPAAGGGLRIAGESGDGDSSLIHHLLLIERRLHVVVGQTDRGVVNGITGEKAPCILTLKPKLMGPHQGQIRSFGYVGAFVSELSALHELSLRDQNGAAASPALRAMLRPNHQVLGHWHPPPLPEEDFALITASRGMLAKSVVTAGKSSIGNEKNKSKNKNQVGLGTATVTRVKKKNAPVDGQDVHAVATDDQQNGEADSSSSDDSYSDESNKKAIKGVGANFSQRSAVCALRFALEKIQGPPGTGKSTTIYHVITQRVPPGERVLVTCSRNVAIESIAQKMEACDAEILVVGAPGQIGATARKHLLDAKVEAHPKVRALAATSLGGFQSKEAVECAKSIRGELMFRCNLILCTIASTSRLLREWEEHNQNASLNVHTVIVDECGCTPESSTALLLNLRPQNLVLLGDHNQLPPCSLINPRELKQTGHDRSALERCVLGSTIGEVRGTDTSERQNTSANNTQNSGNNSCHRLTTQYRMHPQICAVVSKLFYQGSLDTDSTIAEERVRYFEKLTKNEKKELEGKQLLDENGDGGDEETKSVHVASPEIPSLKKNIPSPKKGSGTLTTDQGPPIPSNDPYSTQAMVWVQVNGSEQTPEDGKSYVNYNEITATVSAAKRVRERHGPKVSIAALTFYKGQYLGLIDAMPASLRVECLTVDACQGSEFDFVLISTVRANDRRAVGFVSDPRRINVAISRAKRQCIILGDSKTIGGRPGTDWHCILQMSHREFFSENRDSCRWYADPEPYGFESVMQQKRKDAKLPVESDDKKYEEAAGVNVGASAFVPKAIAAASKQQTKAETKKANKKANKAAKKEVEKQHALAMQAQFGLGMAKQMMHSQMIAQQVMPRAIPTRIMPRNLIMATHGTMPPQMMPPQMSMPPPMPQMLPPMMPRSMPQQGFQRPTVNPNDDEDWKPPARRLNSALDLRELDVLRASGRTGSFDLNTEMPPEWNNGNPMQAPPAFSFGNR